MYLKVLEASPLKRLLQGCLILGCLLPGGVLAGQPQGRWSGVVQQANSDVNAQLVFGTDKVDVHFDDPFACNVPAKFLKKGEVATTTVYRFGVSTNGGKFCQDLQGRDVTFKPGNDGRMAISPRPRPPGMEISSRARRPRRNPERGHRHGHHAALHPLLAAACGRRWRHPSGGAG
jgi:hypothetical protein